MGKLERGTVVEKHSARDLENERTVYRVMPEATNDRSVEHLLTYDDALLTCGVAVTFEHEEVVEYGCVLRIVGDEAVPPRKKEEP